MLWWIIQAMTIGVLVMFVSSIMSKMPRAAAFALSFPITSVIAFVVSWLRFHDADAIARLAREILIIIPLTLVFFVPFIFLHRMGQNFWLALALGSIASAITMGLWFFLSR